MSSLPSSSSNSPASPDPVSPAAVPASVDTAPALAAIKPVPAAVPVSGPRVIAGAAPAPGNATAGAGQTMPAPAALRAKAKQRMQKAAAAVDPASIRSVVAIAGIRPRHRLLVASFALVVLLPILIAAAYLWGKASDQYASTVGFSVRREEAAGALDVLGGLTGLSQAGSSDSDILYEYLRSQKLVADMDGRVNLRAIWSKPQSDPYFAFDPSGTIEDLVDHWQSMVRTSYDSTTGLIEVRVLAFSPADATLIAEALLSESAGMINALSAEAREDSVRYAREDLTAAEDRLRSAREAITAFRVKNQIVDPTTDFQAQAGLVASLESQLAETQIEMDLLGDVPAGDPRLAQTKRRIEVIEARIAAERAKVGTHAGAGQKDYAALASDYERLAVDREFAQTSYVAALAVYDAAKAESQRTSRYLATHVLPTRAEVSRYPERLSMLGLLALFLLLMWSIATLVAYSLKDRR